MAVQQRGNEFVAADRDHDDVDFDVTAAEFLVDVGLHALQQIVGRAFGPAVLVIELVAAKRHHGTNDAAFHHAVEVATPGFPDDLERHRQDIASRRVLVEGQVSRSGGSSAAVLTAVAASCPSPDAAGCSSAPSPPQATRPARVRITTSRNVIDWHHCPQGCQFWQLHCVGARFVRPALDARRLRSRDCADE